MDVAVAVAHYVSQVSDMTVFTDETTVGFIERIVMGSVTCTAVGEITIGVNVNPMASQWLQTSNSRDEVHEGTFAFLLESNHSGDCRVVWVEDAERITRLTANRRYQNCQEADSALHVRIIIISC